MFELQRYEINPHGSRENMLKNRTHHPMRWKGIAQSNDLDVLHRCSISKEHRVINLDNLEVV